MGRKGQSITLSISEREKQQLEALADEYNMKWGNKPNISRLLKAIAHQELLISSNNDWTQERIQTLERARQALIDLGKIEDAREIAKILVQRSELEAPFRREIENFLQTLQVTWRQQIEQYINARQPFKLTYQDATSRLFNFTVLHAQIQLIEKRQYLMCRCEETEGSQDIAELKHNRCLRLDRIQEAAVTAIKRQWEDDLQRVVVNFQVSGGLAFGYNPHSQDSFVSELEGNPPIRRIIRPIYSTFWFFREIAPYWNNCKIISPDNVRNLYLEKVRSLYEEYFSQG
jgi:predicted DNA-binding transcriptional regulator YafY